MASDASTDVAFEHVQPAEPDAQPAEGDAPQAPSTVHLRRLSTGDIAALGRFIAAATTRGELVASSDPDAAYFVRYAATAPNHVSVAVSGDALVGVISPEFKFVAVEPNERRRGIGRLLVEDGIAIEQERGRPELLMGCMPDDPGARAFLAATGFAYHSTLWDLALPEGRPVPAADWPAGLLARPLDRTADPTGFIDLFNAAFAEHPTPLRLDRAQLELLDDPEVEDEDTILLSTEDAPDEPIAFCSTAPHRPGGVVAPIADIWTIGVRPDWQGRGLGRQLLRWGVDRLRSIGVRRVTLSVNGRNERALGLYEREGFERERTRERWARPVRDADATRP